MIDQLEGVFDQGVVDGRVTIWYAPLLRAATVVSSQGWCDTTNRVLLWSRHCQVHQWQRVRRPLRA